MARRPSRRCRRQRGRLARHRHCSSRGTSVSAPARAAAPAVASRPAGDRSGSASHSASPSADSASGEERQEARQTRQIGEGHRGRRHPPDTLRCSFLRTARRPGRGVATSGGRRSWSDCSHRSIGRSTEQVRNRRCCETGCGRRAASWQAEDRAKSRKSAEFGEGYERSCHFISWRRRCTRARS
jgi:hypothetical protein